MSPVISGDIIVKQQEVIYRSSVDNYGKNERQSMSIYEVELTGEEGTINMGVTGGEGNGRAWVTSVLF